MTPPLRVAVVGAGAIAQVAHLPVLRRFPGVEVSAICDSDVGKAQALARRFEVPEYFHSRFMVASSVPLKWDPAQIAERLAQPPDGPGLPAAQRERLLAYFRNAKPAVIQAGAVISPPDERLNRDLFPRDEFFLNNPP